MSGAFILGLAQAAPAPAPAGGAQPAAPAAPAPGQTQQPGTPPPAGPFGCAGGGMSGMVPFVLIFVVFYFMLIRPQQKKQKEQQEWLRGIKKGEEVVTAGGLIGKVTGLTDNVITLELQEKVRVRVLRSSITGKPPAAGGPQSSTPAAESK